MDFKIKETDVNEYKFGQQRSTSSPQGQMRSSGFNDFAKAWNINEEEDDYISKRIKSNNLMVNQFDYK